VRWHEKIAARADLCAGGYFFLIFCLLFYQEKSKEIQMLTYYARIYNLRLISLSEEWKTEKSEY